jgi:beta-galactosidase
MTKMTRRSFTLLTSGGILAGGLLQQLAASEVPVAADADGRTIFPYGAHVYREPHLPLQQFRHDFPILKRLGFTMIKIQEVWGYDEVSEGQIDLSNVSQVVSDARQNGLRVYFGVTMENPPMWLWKKFPDATMVYETGQPHNDPTPYVLPADGKPGPCWHHAEARAAAVRFVEAVGREIGKYDNIEVWNIFQEIGLWPARPGHLGLCYCQNTLPAFRDWLRTRYASLKQLNDTWRAAYGDWDEVVPPRSSPKVPPTIDWRYFMDDVYLSFVLKWKADAFRRSDPLHHPILAHVGGVTTGSTREWRYAEQLDTLGSSCYPGWSGPTAWDSTRGSAETPLTAAAQVSHEIEAILMHFDHLRSSKRDGEIWTAELQGGPITEGLNRRRVPTAEDIRRWILSCLAAGSRGICFWNHRPEIFWEEGYGFSLLDWGSDTSARAEEAGRLSQALNAHADLFAKGEHPQPAVAIVMNEDLYHWAEGSLHDVNEHLQYTITGIWKSLWRKGIPAGFIESAAIPADPSAIKALILPFPVALGPAEIEALNTYVRNGGTLVSEACPGRFSNYGMGFDGAMAPGVPELFGAKHQGVFLIREPGKGAKWTNWEFSLRDSREYRNLTGTGMLAQHSVFPAFYLQTFALTTAQPILMFGDEVAGCVNLLGKGRAYLAGTLLGHAGPAYDDWRNGDFLGAILGQAAIVADRVGSLNRRRRTLGNRAAWFFFNSTETSVEETVLLEKFRTAHDLLDDELLTTGGAIRVKVRPLDVRCILLGS